jgi:prepilin signal peptidase PulO-like enzyme (type II secretory pathway)
MRINPRRYPVIIVLTFVAFLVVALLLGFRPQHGGGGHGATGLLLVLMS